MRRDGHWERHTLSESKARAAAAAYWRATAPFWKEVRAAWDRVLATSDHLDLQSEASGKRLHEALFERADARLPVDAGTVSFIHDTLDKYVVQASEEAGL